MGPASTIDALGATHGGQGQECAVDGISVEIVVDASAHDDLRPAAGINGILCELSGNADCACGRYSGELFLPGWGANGRCVVEIDWPLTWQMQVRAVNTVVCQHEVVDGGEQSSTNLSYRDATIHNTCAYWSFGIGTTCRKVETGEENLGGTKTIGFRDRHHRFCGVETQVPFADALVTVPVGESSAWVHDGPVGFNGEQTVGGVGGAGQCGSGVAKVSGGDKFTRRVGPVVALV